MIYKLTERVKKVLNKMFHQAELPEEPKRRTTRPYRLSEDGGKIYRISLDGGKTYGYATVYGGEPHPIKKSLITRLMDELQTIIKSK